MEHLRPFFHHRTEHFVHEFISFAKSPLDMTAYDHKVSYGLPSSVYGAKRTGTSSDSGDVKERGESSQGIHVYVVHYVHVVCMYTSHNYKLYLLQALFIVICTV